MSNKQFFQLVTAGNIAELNIYGDITSWPVLDTDVSAHNLSAQLAQMQGVTEIHVYINSYGGEVAEGLAIYHALKRHPAKVVTYCDGMACSIASVIFMAGDERIMCVPSFLMIHDAWTCAAGNADELRKQADDLEVITTASVSAYMEHCNLTEEELRALMKAETWLTHTEAVELGFATGFEESKEASDKPAQNAKKKAFEMFMQVIAQNAAAAPQNAEDDEDDEPAEPGGDNGVETPENAPDDDEDKNHNEKSAEDNKKHDEEDPEQAAQRWSGFFNAIFRV